MAPSEETILRSFLLQKAGLRDVITLAEFSAYFPPSKRSSPLVRQLYRDIQSQQNAICESVLKQINLECRLGDTSIAKKRAAREENVKSGEAENELDLQVFGRADSDFDIRLERVLPEMQSAVDELRMNMDRIQQENDNMLLRLQRISGDLSDLKYGTTDQQVTSELKKLVETSDRILAQS